DHIRAGSCPSLLRTRLPELIDPRVAWRAIVEPPPELRRLLPSNAAPVGEPVECIPDALPELGCLLDREEGRFGSEGGRGVAGLRVQEVQDRVQDGEFSPLAERRCRGAA